MKAWIGNLLSRLLNGSRGHCAQSVVQVCLLALPIGLIWSLVMSYTLDRWDAFQFLNQDTLQLVFLFKSFVMLPGWAILLGIGLWARKRAPDATWLPHATAQFYAIAQGFISCLMGSFTELYAAMSLFTGASLGLIFFETKVIWRALYTFVAIIALHAVAEQFDWLPYAPLFSQAPYAGGQLNTGWLLSFGAMNFSLLILAALVLVAAVQRSRIQAKQLERATALICRYVPTQLAARILAGDYPSEVKPQRRKLTVVFSDVVGFTNTADEMEPEELVTLLNEYLAEMADIAEEYGTTINQFVGDGLMIIFGAPETSSDHDNALRAVRMAMSMQERMAQLQERWFHAGFQRPFHIRIGINTGVASVGDFGSAGRRTYSAIGTQTNLAARIQDRCTPGGVLISHSTWAMVKDDIECVPNGEIEVKGIHYPVRTYAVKLAPPAEPRQAAVTDLKHQREKRRLAASLSALDADPAV